jgi:hypothetical protein
MLRGHPPTCLVRGDVDAGAHGAHRLRRHRRLAGPHMPLAEQKLPVQVAGLDRVQVNLEQRGALVWSSLYPSVYFTYGWTQILGNLLVPQRPASRLDGATKCGCVESD